MNEWRSGWPRPTKNAPGLGLRKKPGWLFGAPDHLAIHHWLVVWSLLIQNLTGSFVCLCVCATATPAAIAPAPAPAAAVA